MGAPKSCWDAGICCFPGRSQQTQGSRSYVSDAELEKVVEYLARYRKTVDAGWEQTLESDTDLEMEDDLFWEAVRIFVETGKASVSLLQRKLRVGYARAARLVDIMEERGIISEPDVNRKREVLINEEQLEKLQSRQVM